MTDSVSQKNALRAHPSKEKVGLRPAFFMRIFAARWPHRAVASAQRKAERSDGFSAFTGSRVAALFGATPLPHRQRRSIPALEAWPRRHALPPSGAAPPPTGGGAGGYLHPLRGVAPTTGGDGGSGGRRSRPKRRRSGPAKLR